MYLQKQLTNFNQTFSFLGEGNLKLFKEEIITKMKKKIFSETTLSEELNVF
jgi:hypothetical protein